MEAQLRQVRLTFACRALGILCFTPAPRSASPVAHAWVGTLAAGALIARSRRARARACAGAGLHEGESARARAHARARARECAFACNPAHMQRLEATASIPDCSESPRKSRGLCA
eukprot:6199618-Pleurochrysis_carterae.AAC.2